MDELHFDDVIVGGGSAGCVLANRLSADGGRRVLLIEAGMDTPPEILDSYPMTLFFGDTYIWPGLSAAAGRNAEGKPVIRAYEQGRVMGGGSASTCCRPIAACRATMMNGAISVRVAGAGRMCCHISSS